MSNELEKKDTLWIPVGERMPVPLRSVLIACDSYDSRYQNGMDIAYWRLDSDNAVEWVIGKQEETPEAVTHWRPLPPTPADAPVLSPSEPKEGESKPPFFQLLVDSLNETKDRGPIVISREKLQRLIQGFIEFDKCHSEDVEAAYREGWKRGYETPRDRKLSVFREDWGWDDSEAKKKLEGK